jgi:hypothetical protein
VIVHKGMIVLSKCSLLELRRAESESRVRHACDLYPEAELTSAATIGHMQASA